MNCGSGFLTWRIPCEVFDPEIGPIKTAFQICDCKDEQVGSVMAAPQGALVK